MKFDCVVGNPPYNTPRNVDNNQSKDLYDDFVLLSLALTKKYVSLVIPARWYAKQSKKMQEMRNVIADAGAIFIKNIDPVKAFNLDIKGGCCYFLTDSDYDGDTDVNGNSFDLKSLNEKFNQYLFLDNTGNTILNKIADFSKITNFNAQSTFGVKTNDARFGTGSIKCKVSKSKGGYKNVPNVNSPEKLKKWKVVFPAAAGSGDNISYVPDRFITIESPSVAVSESYIFFDVDSKEEAENLKRYFETKFIKWLMSLQKIKQHVTGKVFTFVPEVSLDTAWSDEIVCKKFDLSKNEFKYICEQLRKIEWE